MTLKSIKKYALWGLLALLCGAVCGLCGAAFSKAVSLVTNLRIENDWLLFLLPLGGLLSVGIYKLCHIKNTGTNDVFDCVKSQNTLPKFLAPAVFCGTCISHFFGASVGREGAALQIGGGVANITTHIFKLDEDSRHVTLLCGMAAVFSAVFGTPLAASAFVLEVILTRLCLSAAIPVLLSSITAFFISQFLNISPERFNVGELPTFSFKLIYKVSIIAIAGIIVAFIFCKGLNLGKSFAKKMFKSEILRIAIGGTLIIGLTILIGTRDYNGGGIDVIERVFEGSVKYEAFAVKLLFTVICVSCGYKGGEIIPTLFIGATLGGSLATLLEIPVGMGAAIGIAVLFVCATKCPVATILLCGEMFGFSSILLITPIVIICYALAGYQGLYNNQKDIFTLIKKE